MEALPKSAVPVGVPTPDRCSDGSELEGVVECAGGRRDGECHVDVIGSSGGPLGNEVIGVDAADAGGEVVARCGLVAREPVVQLGLRGAQVTVSPPPTMSWNAFGWTAPGDRAGD